MAERLWAHLRLCNGTNQISIVIASSNGLPFHRHHQQHQQQHRHQQQRQARHIHYQQQQLQLIRFRTITIISAASAAVQYHQQQKQTWHVIEQAPLAEP